MNDRGQFVLVAAVLVAVAMGALVLAFLQLGYHDDVRADGAHEDPIDDARSVLERAVHEASDDVPTQYDWSRRAAAADAVRADLAPRIDTVERARVASGTYRNVSYNHTLAAHRATAACPGGPNRQFGPCEAIDGVVVQERAGRTHVVAVAFDLRATSERERTNLSVAVDV